MNLIQRIVLLVLYPRHAPKHVSDEFNIYFSFQIHMKLLMCLSHKAYINTLGSNHDTEVHE